MKIEDSNVVRDTLAVPRDLTIQEGAAAQPPHGRTDAERQQAAFDNWRDVLKRRSRGRQTEAHDATKLHGFDLETADPEVRTLVAELTDDIARLIAALEGAEGRIARLADDHAHDPVSGLLTRAAIVGELRHLIALDRREAGHSSVALLRIDQVETVRSLEGRRAVDRLMHHVGQQISEALHTGEKGGVIGDGEVLLLLPGLTDVYAQDRVRTLAQSVIDRPFMLKGGSYDLSAAAGLANIHSNTDPEELIDAADRDLRAMT